MLMPTRGAAAKRRLDPTRNELALRGLVTVAVIALLLGILQLRTSGAWGGPPKVAADLRNAGGSLAPGSDVKLRGSVVGRVTGIERGPSGGVRVQMAMDEATLGKVPADVVARILPATVFGTSYVDLRPTGGAAASRSSALRPGAGGGGAPPPPPRAGDIRMNCDACLYRVPFRGHERAVGAPQVPHTHPDDA